MGSWLLLFINKQIANQRGCMFVSEAIQRPKWKVAVAPESPQPHKMSERKLQAVDDGCQGIFPVAGAGMFQLVAR